MPISARDRQLIASSNQTCSTNVACLTRPSSVVRDGHQRPSRLLLGQAVQALREHRAVLVEEHLELQVERLVEDVLGGRRREGRHARSIPTLRRTRATGSSAPSEVDPQHGAARTVPRGRVGAVSTSGGPPYVDLRPVAEADWRAVHGWASQEEVCRYQAWGPNTEDQTRAFVAEAVAAADERPATGSCTCSPATAWSSAAAS